MNLLVAFVLGAAAWWATTTILRNVAHGGTKIGGQARQKWLGKMDYDTLLRTKNQIDGEVARRQPGHTPEPPTTIVKKTNGA